MLTIRKTQIEALEHVVSEHFVDQMIAHLRRYFPVDYERLGEPSARVAIREGLKHAARYGFRSRGDLCRYIDLTLALGGRFDQDPLLPWAGEILAEVAESGPDQRVQQLDGYLLDWMSDVTGEEGHRYIRAMLRIREMSYDDFEADGGEFTSAARRLLTHLNPAQTERICEEDWARFFALATKYAERFQFVDHPAQMVLATLMFMLGSHVLIDPWHPWVSAAVGPLSDEIDGASSCRGRLLYDCSIAFLEEMLKRIRTSE